MMPIVSKNSTGLNGKICVPGDKSISHRALMLGAVANNTTKIRRLLESEDVMRTANAMRAFGATVVKENNDVWCVTGTPFLKEPTDVLDMGNAGTATRLIAGLVASSPVTCFFTGDDSLKSRPMNRIVAPLTQTGASFCTRAGGRLPMAETGTAHGTPITYTLPVASAQVKSAVLLAGLNIDGTTTVIEPVLCRDHTERMLRAFGADIRVESFQSGHKISLNGKTTLTGQSVCVPADISSAAFFIVGALITKKSDVLLENVGVNPLRTGILTALTQMGADISFENEHLESGEPVADIRVRSSVLHGADISADLAPSMIDEYPVLAVACAFAEGSSRLRGLSELKVKESDRFQAILTGLRANGVLAEADENDILVSGGTVSGGALIHTHLDHRMAMAFLTMGLASQKPVAVDDVSAVATSFPDFIPLFNQQGANIS